jgi:hypothetical protein
MPVDLTIYLDDRPGELARLGEVLGKAGVNIEGFCALTGDGSTAEVHVVVEDAAPAFTALQAAEIEVVTEQEVVIVEVDDRPGALGDMSRRLGAEDVNVTIAYLATQTRLVFGADDLAKARAALE